MDDLLFLQKNFLEDFQRVDSFEPWIKRKGPRPDQRLSVYHNNVTQALRHALKIIYPLTWKLVGEECANGAAYAFIQGGKFLPQTGVLDEWGEVFPDFLENFPPLQHFAYFSDFARLEWLQHLSYGAEDKLPLNPSHFKDMDLDTYESLQVFLHPSARLFSSLYPLDQVMAVAEEKVEAIKLEERGAQALIIRPYQRVHIHWLSPPYFHFFSEVQKGKALLNILEEMKGEPFSFKEILTFSFQHGIFSDYMVEP